MAKVRKRSRSSKEDDPLAATVEAPLALPRLSLLAAGEAIIAEKGFARATVEEIASRAGVSPDVFFAHFSDKGALLRALCERWIAQMSTVTNDATRSGIWATATPSEMVDVAARSAIDAIFDHAPLLRAVLAEGATDSTLADSLKKIGTLLTRRVMKVIDELQTKRDDDVGEREVAFCLLTAIALAHHAILVGADSTGHPFDRDSVAREASRAIFAYLAAPRGPEKSPSTRNIRTPARV